MAKIAILVTAAFMASMLAGCTSSIPLENPAQGTDITGSKATISSGTAALFMSKSITTLDVEKTQKRPEEITIEARDETGNPTLFVVNGTSECVNVKTGESGVYLTGLKAPCTATFMVEVPATKESRKIIVHVKDPLTMDIGEGLTMRYWNNFVKTGDVGNVRLMEPKDIPDGYFSLGTSALDQDVSVASSSRVASIILSDTQNRSLLAAPESYHQVFNDGRSVWAPICPDNFVALGVVIIPGTNAPSLDHVRCVREDFTTPATIGAIRYSHYRDGADMVLRSIEGPKNIEYGELRVPLPSHSYIQCSDGDSLGSCTNSAAVLHKLMIPADVVEKVDNTDMDVQLVGPEPLDETMPRFHTGVRMPFTLVPGAMALTDRADVIENSPFYSVYRTESFTTLEGGIIDNRQGAEPISKEYSITSGYAEEETTGFSETVGISIEMSGSGPVGPEVTASFSYEFTHSRESKYSYSHESTSTTVFTIPGGAYAQLVQISSEWTARDNDGDLLKGGRADAGALVTKYLQYPLPA
jgi:hypothetical protein